MSILVSIEKTIKYSKRFGGKLTDKQLFERLIDSKIYKKNELRKTVQKLPRIKKELINLEQNKIKEKKIEKTKELAKKITFKFKDILFLGITGSIAADYPKKNDDIDIVLITKINKLWITRLKLRFFIIISKIPHRKFGKKEKKDEFCFNLWLDEGNLLLPKNKQNLRSAMDLILMKVIVNNNKTYEKFVVGNSWAKKYVATGYNKKISGIKFGEYDLKIKENLVDRMVNWLVFWPQFWYMKKRIKNEKIGLNEAFFHH
jgi:hypothetical protein